MNRIIKKFLVFYLLLSFLAETQAQDLPDTTIMIGEVTVSAYRTSTNIRTSPGSIAVLSASDLSVSDRQNLSTILNTLPGVTMQSGTLTTNRIVIRGMGSRTPYNSNRIRVYLNEIPFTSSDGISSPEEIDMQGIGRMEIIKGPSSAIYGSGLGGTINMYTPVKAETEGSVTAQYGSYNTGMAHLSGTVKSGNLLLWGNLSHLNSEGYRENNDYRRTTLLTTARLEQKRWLLTTTLLLMDVKGGIPSSVGRTQFENTPWQAAPNWLAIKGFKEYIKGVAAINLKYYINPRLNADAMVFGRLNDNYEKRPFNNLDDQALAGGFRYKISLKGSKLEWVSGTEVTSEQYSWKLDLNNSLINENSERRILLNAFSILSYKPLSSLDISLAGAVNYVSYRLRDLFPGNGDQSGERNFPVIFSPRLGVNYSPNEHFAFYGSAGHGFSLPSPEETLLPAGDVNPEIKPEQGMQYELGTRISPLPDLMIDAVVYWIELNNLLVTRRITEDIFTGVNAGKSRHQGLELLLKAGLFDYGHTFPGKLSGSLSYTRSLNRFIKFNDNEIIYDGNNLPGIPSQSIQMQLTWNMLKSVELYAHIQYTGEQYLTDDNSAGYPGYFIANTRSSFSFDLKEKRELSLYAGINNVSGSTYASMLIVNAIGFGNSEPRYYYPGLPANWYTGIRFSF